MPRAKGQKNYGYRDPNVAMTFEEIGRVMGLTEGATKMIFYNGMRKLRSNPEMLRLFHEFI